MVKLVIQIPCFNEEDQLPATLADLPRDVDGFDEVIWMIVDDGSEDATIDVAVKHGVDHVVRLPQNKGLATAFQVGLDAALKLGADVVVNTDADNQYSASSIPDLVAPILEGAADLVIGDRRVQGIEEFSPLKKSLQRLGSGVVRAASGTDVADATSGFRAYSRDAAMQLSVVSPYTYTIESIIQAGRSRSAVHSVPVGTNPKTRDSRLFSSMWGYVRRNGFTIVRVYAAYSPMRFFGAISILLGLGAGLSFLPFLLDWIRTGDTSGHLQSIVLGAILAVSALQVLTLAVVADLIAAHRVVTQRAAERIRRIELELDVAPSGLVEAATTGELTHDELHRRMTTP